MAEKMLMWNGGPSSPPSISEHLGAEASSANLIHQKCPRPTARFHSWQIQTAEPHQSGAAKSASDVRVVFFSPTDVDQPR